MTPGLLRVRAIGRMAAWLVLILLAGSMVYLGIIAVMNWGPIGV